MGSARVVKFAGRKVSSVRVWCCVFLLWGLDVVQAVPCPVPPKSSFLQGVGAFFGSSDCKPGMWDCAYCNTSIIGKPEDCASFDGMYRSPEGVVWSLVFSTVIAAVMAFAIGANDSANSWGTSVGSGAITLRKACLIGGAMEWLGAITLGSAVSTTIQNNIAHSSDPDCWACGFCDSKVPVYAIGMFSALIGAALFLMLATYTSMPVSATHAIVGAVVGMTLMGTGFQCLNWDFETGLGGIAASWALSPLAAGFIGVCAYWFTSCCMVRTRSPVETTLRVMPLLFFVSITVVVGTIFIKLRTIGLSWIPFAIAIASGIAMALIVYCFVVPKIRQDLAQIREKEKEVSGDDEEMTEEAKQTVQEEEAIYAFRYLLVSIAALESFAHGANDTANATAPLAAVYSTYSDGLYACSSDGTPIWLMGAAGFFVFLGIVFMGGNVISTIGEDLTSVNFQTAFCVEFASTFAVIFFSAFGFPVSMTHCQVGAVVFVGLVSVGNQGVSWHLLGYIGLSWLCTLPFAGGVAALATWLFTMDIETSDGDPSDSTDFPESAVGSLLALLICSTLTLYLRNRSKRLAMEAAAEEAFMQMRRDGSYRSRASSMGSFDEGSIAD